MMTRVDDTSFMQAMNSGDSSSNPISCFQLFMCELFPCYSACCWCGQAIENFF